MGCLARCVPRGWCVVNPVAILLDVTALAVASGSLGSLELSLHGDATVAALHAWATVRGLEVQESIQHHQVAGSGYTVGVNTVRLGDNQRVTAFGDWRRVEAPAPTERQAIPVIADQSGGAA